MLKKKLVVIVLSLIFLSPIKALAVCPVCVVAIAGGVGLSRWLKVDDTITGIWIGGFLISLIYSTIYFLDKKKIKFWGKNILISATFYALAILPLYYADIIGHPLNSLWGIDKLLLGTIIGTIVTIIVAALYPVMKRKDDDKPFFPFQKVVMPMIALAILSFVFYLITKK